jgi:hypothetical protein
LKLLGNSAMPGADTLLGLAVGSDFEEAGDRLRRAAAD